MVTLTQHFTRTQGNTVPVVILVTVFFCSSALGQKLLDFSSTPGALIGPSLLQTSGPAHRQTFRDSTVDQPLRIRAQVEVRGYYHRTLAGANTSTPSREGYFRHRRSRLVVESQKEKRFWARLAVAAQPQTGESKRVLTGDKRYFGTNLMLDLDEAFAEARLGRVKVRFGRQYVQLGLSPDHALVVDDYDFTADDHADAIHNALKVEFILPAHFRLTSLISRTRQGLDKPYGGDPVPYGSRSLFATQVAYCRSIQQALALYIAADHNVVDVPCDSWYRGLSVRLDGKQWQFYAETALMSRQRPDGQLDHGWAWYIRLQRRLAFQAGTLRVLARHAAFSSDNPRTRATDETFLSAFNHFRLGESLDHRKTDGKSVYELRLGWTPNRCPQTELAIYTDLRQPFALHPLARTWYPKPLYDWTGDEIGAIVSQTGDNGQIWASISVYLPHRQWLFDEQGKNAREFLLIFGMNVYIGGKQ